MGLDHLIDPYNQPDGRPMKTLFTLLVAVCVVAGCAADQPPPPSSTGVDPGQDVDLGEEREAVQQAIRSFFDGYEAEEWNRVREVLTTSGEFQFFGTDSAEVSMGLDDFQRELSEDWQALSDIKMGALRNLSIAIDEDGELASAIYEATFSGTPSGGEPFTALARFASTLRKENGSWRYVHGLIAAPSTGSSTDNAE